MRTDEQRLLQLWKSPDRVLLSVHQGRLDFTVDDVADRGEAVLLGLLDGVPWFALRRASPGERELREIAADLTPVQRSAAMTAVALDNWHRTHQRCSRCGQATEIERAGWMRRCPADDSEHFPRTDPAVIVLVVDDQQRALLGRRAVWPETWMSTLAGFVEPGETFEQAVVREIREEAGVELEIGRVRYRGSQPWPFPASVMIAFTAEAAVQSTTPDGVEIVQTDWLSREQFRTAGEAGRLRIPPPVSVAYQLISDWYGEQIPHTWSR